MSMLTQLELINLFEVFSDISKILIIKKLINDNMSLLYLLF